MWSALFTCVRSRPLLKPLVHELNEQPYSCLTCFDNGLVVVSCIHRYTLVNPPPLPPAPAWLGPHQGPIQPLPVNRRPVGIAYANTHPNGSQDHLKPAQLANGMYPGPLIEANEGDIIELTVINNLRASGTTIHFHGLHMRGTPWNDGPVQIAQAPIMPNTNYTYRFEAYPAGTFYWHSHMDALQQSRGLKVKTSALTSSVTRFLLFHHLFWRLGPCPGFCGVFGLPYGSGRVGIVEIQVGCVSDPSPPFPLWRWIIWAGLGWC